MIYTPLIKKAMELAYDYHKDQLDKGCMPYIFHPYHLAEQMETEHEICVALLHDILEDTNLCTGELRDAGFPEEWIEDIKRLTKSPDQTYKEYILALAPYDVCRKVKLADLKHNSDLTRLSGIWEQDMKRKEKYQKFIKILENWE